MTPPRKPRERQRAKHDKMRQQVSRREQELRQAKNAGAQVRFTLAVETNFTSEDCEVIGIPIEFDQGDVKVRFDAREVWLTKFGIIAFEVLR